MLFLTSAMALMYSTPGSGVNEVATSPDFFFGNGIFCAELELVFAGLGLGDPSDSELEDVDCASAFRFPGGTRSSGDAFRLPEGVGDTDRFPDDDTACFDSGAMPEKVSSVLNAASTSMLSPVYLKKGLDTSRRTRAKGEQPTSRMQNRSPLSRWLRPRRI